MAFLSSLAWLAVVAAIAAVAIAFGAQILAWLNVSAPSVLEECLYAAGVSFAFVEVAVFSLLVANWLHRGTILALLILMALGAWKKWKVFGELKSAFVGFLTRIKPSRMVVALLGLIAVLIFLDALLAMAPLTGSDAMHYHFTVPLLWLHYGFRPLYDITLSFAVGQSHMLILLGLALGSDHISLGLIFLGGVLSAAALYRLARGWVSVEWSLVAMLAFLLTPMVFWQMTVAGAPDIWMTFYCTLAVLAGARCVAERSVKWAALGGIFAGTAAGSKYPSWAIPAALCILLLFESRCLRPAIACFASTLASGAWPLLRNAYWTRDPFFPFLTRWLAPRNLNPYALAAFLEDTGAASHRGLLSWLLYPFHMILQGRQFGVGYYFGPLILAFAPLLLLAYRRTPLFRIAAGIWGAMFLTNVASSQGGRFLLPVFGIALAISFAGAESAMKSGRLLLRVACAGTVIVFLLFGAASYAAYSRSFFPVGLGFESREGFLERLAPNYQEIEFINATLERKPGVALVFLRHTYYLDGEYLVGDPASSWRVNPEFLQTPSSLSAFLHASDVKWVVKTGDFPWAIQQPLEALEANGDLALAGSTEVQDFSGRRMQETKEKVLVQIFEVRPEDSP